MSKRIDVSFMVDYANKQLARTDEYADLGFKEGVCTMIHEILFKSGNYAGFMFLDNSDSQTGTLGYFSRRYCKSSKIQDTSGR
jgi:hypothetical protein